MGQAFQYPNLVVGTRDKSNPLDLHNASQTNEKIFHLWTDRNNQIKPYTDYTLSCWVDRTDNMKSSDVILLDVPVRYTPVWSADRYQIPVGGGYVSWTFQIHYRPSEKTRYAFRFDNNGSTDGEDSVLRVRDVMLCEGTTPRAWAPAEGEVWPE